MVRVLIGIGCGLVWVWFDLIDVLVVVCICAGVFEYDLTSLKVGLGSYALTVAVNPASALYDNIDTYILTVKVLGVATVSTATV